MVDGKRRTDQDFSCRRGLNLGEEGRMLADQEGAVGAKKKENRRALRGKGRRGWEMRKPRIPRS